jgi:uncharacterized protein (TIGR03083 family)
MWLGAEVSRDERWRAVAEERLALADALDGIAPDAWDTPSRCTGWAVRDVVAHLVHLAEGTGFSILVGGALVDPRPSRSLDKVARRLAGSAGPDELVARLRAAAGGRFVVPGLPPEVALGEVLVHRADLAVPAGLAPRPADERTRSVLEAERRLWFAFGVSRRVRDILFAPTDADWTVGPPGGLVASGPGEALLLIATGRDPLPGDRACIFE